VLLAGVLGKQEKAKALLAHQVDTGDIAVVLELALEQLIAQKMKQKFALTDKPRKGRQSRPKGKDRPKGKGRLKAPEPSSSGPDDAERQTAPPTESETGSSVPARAPVAVIGRNSRHIPAAVKRAVLKRDGMRCTYVDEFGERCCSTAGLEFHHKKPFALGGESTIDNTTLRCRPHNDYQAQIDFGAQHVRRRNATSRMGGQKRRTSPSTLPGDNPVDRPRAVPPFMQRS